MQALIHLVSCMIEAATAKKANITKKVDAAEEENKQPAASSSDDVVLNFFKEINIFEALKQLKLRQKDRSMRDEIQISVKFMKVKLAKF